MNKVRGAILAGLAFMTVGAALQSVFAPTLVLSLTRPAAGFDVHGVLQSRVIFDLIPVRHRTIRGVRSAEVAELRESRSTSGRRGATPYKLEIMGDAGAVRAASLGDFAELAEVKNRVGEFIADPAALRTRIVSRPSTHPWRAIATGVFLFGALYWLYLPFQIARLRREATRRTA